MENAARDVGEARRGRLWWKLLLLIGTPWVLLLSGAIFIRSAVIEPYNVPGGSMSPTLQVGELFFVTKRLDRTALTHGDVVVFRMPSKGADFVKRVVGLPGDTVQMQGGRLHINGTAAAREPAGEFLDGAGRSLAAYRELLPDGSGYGIVEMGDNRVLDNTPVFAVPPGHLFVMGDNRDNSLDSRVAEFGYVPIENLIGRVTFIYWSDDPGRIFTRVE